MKAIETHYKGYRFRSRLEARWAVFFDAMGLRWEYEPEGFELPSGCYLPDFRLFDATIGWVEVKGVEPSALDLHLAEDLADGSDRTVFVSVGLPDEPGHLFTPRHGQNPGVLLAHCLGSVLFPRFADAALAARGARFEHGENGAQMKHTSGYPDDFEALARTRPKT